LSSPSINSLSVEPSALTRAVIQLPNPFVAGAAIPIYQATKVRSASYPIDGAAVDMAMRRLPAEAWRWLSG
jgi:hypothetical protein